MGLGEIPCHFRDESRIFKSWRGFFTFFPRKLKSCVNLSTFRVSQLPTRLASFRPRPFDMVSTCHSYGKEEERRPGREQAPSSAPRNPFPSSSPHPVLESICSMSSPPGSLPKLHD